VETRTAEGMMDAQYQATAEKTYRAIGRFIFEFSQLEYSVRHYLGEAIGVKEEHFSAVVESYDVGMLINVTRQVFKKSRSGEVTAKIDKLLNKFSILNDDRKRVAHGLWWPFEHGGTVGYVSRNKLDPRRFTDQANALEQLADDANKLRFDLENAFQ
jgi:hypothetical protein